jgi:ribosome maturation protein Sdo1
MAEAGYSVRANKNAKSQVCPFPSTDLSPLLCVYMMILTRTRLVSKVSECIKALQSDSTLPIQRAKMRIRVVVPAANIDDLRERLLDGVDKLEHEDKGEEWSGVGRLPVSFQLELTPSCTDDVNRSRAAPGDLRAA